MAETNRKEHELRLDHARCSPLVIKISKLDLITQAFGLKWPTS